MNLTLRHIGGSLHRFYAGFTPLNTALSGEFYGFYGILWGDRYFLRTHTDERRSSVARARGVVPIPLRFGVKSVKYTRRRGEGGCKLGVNRCKIHQKARCKPPPSCDYLRRRRSTDNQLTANKPKPIRQT